MKKLITDTIAAIATPAGRGSVSIVRLSGADAVSIAASIIKDKQALLSLGTHRVLHSWVIDEGQLLDEVLLVLMRSPRSFTAEDVVEVHCHGGPIIAKMILQMLLKHGARLARAGEFTMRAYVNGRIDLTRAEAINNVVNARAERELLTNINQLRGKLYQSIIEVKQPLIHAAALLTAALDFPDEDLGVEWAQVEDATTKAHSAIKDLLKTGHSMRYLKSGLRMAIVGAPNVGKSSLLNALLGYDRAIVSDIAGTTRDTLEESIEIKGVNVQVIDTAGIRKQADSIEDEGIRRAQEQAQQADLCLLVIDSSHPLATDTRQILKSLAPQNTVVVLNKNDLPQRVSLSDLASFDCQSISVLTKSGLDELLEHIFELFIAENIGQIEDPSLTTLRQYEAATKADKHLNDALELARLRRSEELIAANIQAALDALGEIIGEHVSEEVLDAVFSEFCIGK